MPHKSGEALRPKIVLETELLILKHQAFLLMSWLQNVAATSFTLSWSPATDNVAVTGYNVYEGTTLVNSVANTTYTVTGLIATTNYSFTVTALDAATNESAASSTVAVTTLSSNGGTIASELFFSEYVEGASYNKALEIANFTGNGVSLSVLYHQKTNQWLRKLERCLCP